MLAVAEAREHLPWQDKPVEKTYTVEGSNDKKYACRLGNTAINLFRRRPDMDYLAHYDKESDHWTYIYDMQPVLYWMGNIALSSEAAQQRHLMDKKMGFKDFYTRYGWNPNIFITDYPEDYEIDVYMDYLMSRDGELHEDLERNLKEDLENG